MKSISDRLRDLSNVLELTPNGLSVMLINHGKGCKFHHIDSSYTNYVESSIELSPRFNLHSGNISLSNFSTKLPVSSKDYRDKFGSKVKYSIMYECDEAIMVQITDDYGKLYYFIATGEGVKHPLMVKSLELIQQEIKENGNNTRN